MPNYIPGVDRSHHNSKISLASLAQKGIGFILLKGTEATTYKDATFNDAWTEIQAIPGNNAGQLVKRGVYHFFDPRFGGAEQAKNYLSLNIDFSLPGCLPPFVDVEDLVGKKPGQTAELNKWVADNWQTGLQRLNDFLSAIKTGTGRDCIIYTYNGYMREYYHSHAFPNNGMWLSSLQDHAPLRYDTNQLSEFWQNTYSWNGTDMDGDYFTGDAEAFNKLANIAPIALAEQA